MTSSVLIVDDHDLELKAFSMAFESRGITAITTTDGEKAVSLAKKHMPDFIVLDLYLGEQSGFDVCKQLKLDYQTRDIPVLLVTGSENLNDAIQSFHFGCIDYIHKPVGIDALVDTVLRHKTVQVIKEAFKPLRACLESFADKYSEKDDKHE